MLKFQYLNNSLTSTPAIKIDITNTFIIDNP